MARPKLKKEDRRKKLSITIDPKINEKLETLTNNKSLFIEDVLRKELKL